MFFYNNHSPTISEPSVFIIWEQGIQIHYKVYVIKNKMKYLSALFSTATRGGQWAPEPTQTAPRVKEIGKGKVVWSRFRFALPSLFSSRFGLQSVLFAWKTYKYICKAPKSKTIQTNSKLSNNYKKIKAVVCRPTIAPEGRRGTFRIKETH